MRPVQAIRADIRGGLGAARRHRLREGDTEDQQELAREFGITSIPTVMAFRDGVRVFSQPGALPKKQLEDLISQVEGLDMDDVRRKIEESKK